VPESEIESGEFVALLAAETLPVTLPDPDGANIAVKAAVCPGAMISPEGTPAALKPAPETLTFEIVTVEFPALVKVTVFVLLLDTVTLPKLSEEELQLRRCVAALTVSVAALLVALPPALLTATVNWALLSAVVSAGVV
jgi:hypothetical protein